MKRVTSIGRSAFSSHGFTLVEALVSAFIITSVVLGPLTVALDASANARLTKETITAAYLAQEGIELLRMVQDTVYLRCTLGQSLCPISGVQTTSDAAWGTFKGYLGFTAHSVAASCYRSDGSGCTYDMISMTENLGNTTNISPTTYNTLATQCQMLALSPGGVYVCVGVHGNIPGTQPGKYMRKVLVDSITTTGGGDAAYNDDLRVTSSVTFVRPIGTTKTVTIVDFLHARS
jgi:type II secretory pathway pseudopilin PulG